MAEITIHREPPDPAVEYMIPLIVDVEGRVDDYSEGRVRAYFEGEPIELTEPELFEAQVALMGR